MEAKRDVETENEEKLKQMLCSLSEDETRRLEISEMTLSIVERYRIMSLRIKTTPEPSAQGL